MLCLPPAALLSHRFSAAAVTTAIDSDVACEKLTADSLHICLRV